MLLSFNFKNFRAFYEKNELNMKATTKRELSQSLLNFDGTRVLPTAIIYGGNAVGKTSIILAQMMFKDLLISGNIHGKKTQIYGFLYSEEKYKSPMMFDIVFTEKLDKKELKENKIRYKCEIVNDMNIDSKIINEELYIDNIMIFTKNEKSLEFNLKDEALKYYFLNDDNINDKTSGEENKTLTQKDIINALNMQITLFEANKALDNFFTTWFKNYNPRLVEGILNWFKNKYILFHDFNNMKSQFLFEINETQKVSGINLLEDQGMNLLKNAIEYGNQKIVFSAEEEDTLGQKKAKLNSVYTMKLNGNKEKQILIPAVLSESRGTLKMYEFLIPLIYALKNGATLVIDELDASIHTRYNYRNYKFV